MATFKEKSQRDFRLQSNKNAASLEFNKIKVGKSTLSGEIASSIIGNYSHSTRHNKFSRAEIERAIADNNLPQIRRISEYYFQKSGIYSRLCRYMAYLYRYDWFITPHRYDDKIKDDKVVEGWIKASTYLDDCNLKTNFGKYALAVIKQGCFYGYMLEDSKATYLQKLPVDYCRSRYEINGMAAVEFNIKFFDDCFSDNVYKLRVLKAFPKEFQKAYVSYKNGTLPKDFVGDDSG